MNDIMSVGIHRFWKDYLIDTLYPIPGMKLIDVAGGTGDIALRFLDSYLKDDEKNTKDFAEIILRNEEHVKHLEAHVVVLDMNENMLSICKDKAKNAGYSRELACIQGNAEMLPLPSDHFDAYTIGFGIRNVVHIEKALSEAKRVLKPGGRFLCLEFSQVQDPLFSRLSRTYNHEVIPVIGQVVAGDWKSYQYLAESIEKFPNQEKFKLMIEDAGFSMVTYENLLNGIAAIHSAYKL